MRSSCYSPVRFFCFCFSRFCSCAISFAQQGICARNGILIVFSLIFYSFGGLRYTALLLCSVLLNYTGAMGVSFAKRDTARRYIMIAGVAANLALLGYFKYAGFAVSIVNDLGAHIPVPEIVLPLGISFYTFQGMSYLLRRPVVNDVVVLRDEHVLLPYTPHEYESGTLDPAEIDAKAERIADRLEEHKTVTESYGGYFCYVAVPFQYVCFADLYPSYLNNRAAYTERSTAALFGKLEEKEIPYIDLRQVYGKKMRTYSSTVDHHYGMEGAFAAYRALVERLDADTSLALPVPELADFQVTRLENPYFGAWIRKLCGL